MLVFDFVMAAPVMSAKVTVVLEDAVPVFDEQDKECVGMFKLHRVLKSILGSALSKSGNLQIYIHSTKNVLIEMSHLFDIPDDPSEFNEVMHYLLRRYSVKAANGVFLAKVIKNPIEGHLPPNSIRMRLCSRANRVNIDDIKASIENGVVFFISMDAEENRGIDNEENICVSVSSYKLSVENCCMKLAYMLEEILAIF